MSNKNLASNPVVSGLTAASTAGYSCASRNLGRLTAIRIA